MNSIVKGVPCRQNFIVLQHVPQSTEWVFVYIRVNKI